MKTRKLWLTVVVAAALVLAAGAAGAVPAASGSTGTVAPGIQYQGRLTDPSGTPLSGTFPMRFQLYDDPGAGTLLWDSGIINVEVANGLFNAVLGVDPVPFNGQGLWLRLQVDGEWLAPRQELLPVPYALSLRPGAEVKGEPTAWEGWVLNVTMDGAYPLSSAILGSTATGTALFGESAGGYGLQGYTNDGYAVAGQDMGSAPARGYGGYFTSQNGVGVYGYSNATSSAQNQYTPGVFGRSANGVGVYGKTLNASPGVRGESTLGSGVSGVSESPSTDDEAGVTGLSRANGGVGVRGRKTSGLGAGVYGSNTGTSGSGVIGESTNYVGVWASSGNFRGVSAATGATDHNYGLYTEDNLYSLNVHLAGAILQLVQNGGSEPLEPGDVAVFSGVTAPLEEGGAPVVQVAKAIEANSTAVAGVVYRRFDLKTVTAQLQAIGQEPQAAGQATLDGPVPPGEYLLLVVQGPCQVKVDAAQAAIQPGDVLSSAGLAGHSAPAAEGTVAGQRGALPGAVLGKALEPLAAGQGLVYAYVTLQ